MKTILFTYIEIVSVYIDKSHNSLFFVLNFNLRRFYSFFILCFVLIVIRLTI